LFFLTIAMLDSDDLHGVIRRRLAQEVLVSQALLLIPHADAAREPRAIVWPVSWECSLFMVIALLVRCIGLTRFDLGADEGHSFLTASTSSILDALRNDTNPPLYFVLLKSWMAAFGSSLLAMRLFSALCGSGAVGVLGAFAGRCSASRSAIRWTLALAAFNPVDLHYAQQARGYALATLLLSLALWSFMVAIRSNRRGAWLAHGTILALTPYTHALLAAACAAFPIAALLMKLPRRTLRVMALTYALAALAALPAVFLILHQEHSSGGLAWIRPYWLATPPLLAIPRSLGLLGLGGDMPAYLLSTPPAFFTRLLAAALTLAAAFAFLQSALHTANCERAIGVPQRIPLLLFLFVFWPLGLIWVYSLLRTPIYLVGRYDLFAQPAYLVLLGSGFAALQARFLPRFRFVIPLLVSTVLLAGLWGRYSYPLNPALFHHEAQVEFLAAAAAPGDAIICTGLEAAPTLYHLEERHMNLPVSTFPLDTMNHIGWMIDDAAIVARRSDWTAEARAALAPSAHHGSGRVWILVDSANWTLSPIFAPSPRQQLSIDFIETARSLGWRRVASDAAQIQREDALHMICLQAPDPWN